jgi:hypothetical protein
MDRYAYVGLRDEAAAVEALPPIPSSGPNVDRQVMKATETDGRIPCHSLALPGDTGRLRLIPDDNVHSPEATSRNRRKPVEQTTVKCDREPMIAIDSPQAPVAQLDRASVYGTEG